MTVPSEKIGLLAGLSDLPLEVVRAVERAGTPLFVAAFKGAADPAIEVTGRDVKWFSIGRLQALLDGLRASGARDLVLAGKLPHEVLFSSGDFDDRLVDFLNSLPDRRGSSILGGFVDLLISEGFRVRQLIETVPELVPEAGHLAGPLPTEAQMEDARFGWRIAKTIAGLDIGQTVVVKDLAVVSVEGMEGTDETVTRAGSITGGQNIVVKVSSPNHDFRFDVPTVGPGTVSSLSASGGGVLAVEAGRCFLMGGDNLFRECAEKAVSLVALDETDISQGQRPVGDDTRA